MAESTLPPNDAASREAALIEEAEQSGCLKRYAIYTRLSGPGWLQGAITLGGGSLAGSLYLGVAAGYDLLWLQPLAMVCGVLTLSAISYVTLSTGKRPFGLLNKELSPALGWAWLIATVMANTVWCMPQFTLAIAAVEQNLVPAVGTGTTQNIVLGLLFLISGLLANALYDKGGLALKIFERGLKALVGVIVLAFILVAATLLINGDIELARMGKGLLPNPANLFKPSSTYEPLIAQTGEYASYWQNKITGIQRDRIMTAFGTAVGINMTFLLPYSMLKKGWGIKRRSLAIFDLSIGLIVPFVLATTCVVLASAASFHGQTQDVLNEDGTVKVEMAGSFHKVLDQRVKAEHGTLAAADLQAARNAIPEADRQLSAMLSDRDNLNLAQTLTPLAGETISQKIFGVGVLGMAVSTLIVLMMMNGFAFQEIFNQPNNRKVYMLGALASGIGGFCGPFLWTTGAKAALAVPTSVIGGCMLPIACFSFLLLVNSRRVLGDALPKGRNRAVYNALLVIATSITTFGSVWVLWNKGTPGKVGIVLLVLLVAAGLVGFMKRRNQPVDA